MSRAQVSRDDWTHAALEALAEGGVSAVRVDAIARRMKITRGSFYWHFKDRDALLAAALEEWERLSTTEVLEQLKAIVTPAEQLRALLTHALAVDELTGLEPALAAHADHPIVAPVLRRVTDRRVGWLTEAYRELGLAPAVARRQAVVAYAAFVGWLELRRAAPDVVPEVGGDSRTSQAALDYLAQVLVPDEDRSA
ncbi:TetR/AcrR family transcriptional regulator [Nonomuraea basaltis]|uniref:TetR/AcrR family transcriptional regulator n=1 Tax=Nonomuraea basaltis TaxID=2495887 RepID=UPI00110C4546|nr:TetR/AcrR family transcriptional regulator [Nonomuraea basaltis]TMS00499.1 TetR/AcrR family transcriptional regulator [Nonomuraea basaltis]